MVGTIIYGEGRYAVARKNYIFCKGVNYSKLAILVSSFIYEPIAS